MPKIRNFKLFDLKFLERFKNFGEDGISFVIS